MWNSLPYRKSYYAKKPHILIRHLSQEVKWFLQRGKRGWADCDVWGFDQYIAGVISAAVKQLQVENHGHPTNVCDCTHDDSYTHVNCNGSGVWEQILGQISDGFAAAKDDNDFSSICIEFDADRRTRFDGGMAAFHKYFFNLWD